MSEWMELIPLLMAVVLYLLGMPIVYALLGSSVFYFLYLTETAEIWAVFSKALRPMLVPSAVVIPFFIMSGALMSYSGIRERMLRLSEALTGHRKGGLAQVNVVLSMMLGGCSGSANADCAMQSQILVPEMEKKGYSRAFSAAITAASSSVTPVIPPGVNLMIFALIAGIPVEKMFSAGYIPGILMALAMMLVVNVISARRDYPKLHEKKVGKGEILRRAISCLWGPLFPVGFILGTRYGLFTPAEGGALAVLYCLIMGKLVYRRLSIKRHLLPVLLETISGTAHAFLLFLAVHMFEEYLYASGLFRELEIMLLSEVSGKYSFLFLTNAVFLLFGMFIEGGMSLLLLTPLLLPAALLLGIDPVHFGIVAVVNVVIGGITPPFGSLMYTTCGITGCPTMDFLREVWPFIAGLLAVLFICTFCPGLVTYFPDLLWG